MGIPTPEELETALAEAARLREQGLDEHHLGKALLSLDHRMKFMEDVLRRAAVYLHSGEGTREHAELVRAVERAEQAASPGDDEGLHPW